MSKEDTRKGEPIAKTGLESPVPLFGAMAPETPFPLDACGPLKDPIEAIHTIAQAPIALCAQCVLAAEALLVQGRADVETLSGQSPTSLFLLTVASSGERKSFCDRLASKAIADFEAKRIAEFHRLERAFRKKHEEEPELIEDEFAVLETVPGEPTVSSATPKPPVYPQMRFSDFTLEGLVKHFERGTPSIGLFSDEAGSILGGFSMKRENRLRFFAGLSKLWGGQPLDHTRASLPAKTHPGKRVSAHFMVQPGSAKDFLSDPVLTDQGLGARFLAVWPTSTMGTRFIVGDHGLRGELAKAHQSLEKYYSRQTKSLEAPLPTLVSDDLTLDPPLLCLSDTARHHSIEFHNLIEGQLGPGGKLERFSGFASKITEQACRIAGVLTHAANSNAKEVSAATTRDAICIAEWYLQEHIRIFDQCRVPEELRQAEDLRRWLVDNYDGSYVTPRIIVNRGPGHLRNTTLIRSLIEILEKTGWLQPTPKGTCVDGKQARKAWLVVTR